MLKSFAMLSMLAITTAPAIAGEPSEVVRFFYENPGVESQPENRGRFTGPALEFLNVADAAWDRDETVCIDFGFSVNAQDFDEAEISRTLKLDENVSGDTAHVIARFDNFGQPTKVEWTLSQSAAGWQVTDIASEANQWRVSSMSCE